MRLADFILANIEPILAEWEVFARDIWPGSMTDPATLRDDAADVLHATGADMKSAQTVTQQADKSKGNSRGGDGSLHSARMDRASVAHGRDRHGWGFDLPEVISEYRALRASVIRLWRKSRPSPDVRDLEDLTRFNESIDQSLTEGVVAFDKIVERQRKEALDVHRRLSDELREMNEALLVSSVQAQEDRDTIASVEREMSDFFETASIGLHWVGPDGTILRVNQAELDMLGYGFPGGREEYLGHHIAEFHADQPVIEDILARLLRGETLRDWPARLRRRDGSIRDVLITSSAYFENGRFIHTRCFTDDITERKQAEQARARLAAIVESSEDAIISKDLDGVIATWNRGAQHLFGYKVEEAVGKRVTILIPDDRLDEEPRIIERIRSGHAVEHFETVRQRKDGSLVDVSLTISPIRDAAGMVIGASEVARDITQRKRDEMALLQMQKLESVGVFAGGIAHDFNNLLTGILGASSLVSEMPDVPDDARPLLEHVSNACLRAADLTRQILAYAGRGRFIVESLDLSGLVREITELIRVSVPKNAEIRLELAADLPVISGDRGQLQQVVMNLVLNAAESLWGEPGVISVSTGICPLDKDKQGEWHSPVEAEPGQYVVFRVQDHGFGMDEKTAARIFDPFFSTKSDGRGLGLSAVLGIVRGHKGGLRVYSAPGDGSTFEVLFPFADAGARSSPREREIDPPAAISLKRKRSGTVLVVDDEDLVRDVVKSALEQFGYTVLTASNGRECVEQVEASDNTIERVLLDLIMPVMGGQDALKRIRELRPELPVIVMSGYTQQELNQSVADDGHVAFLQKPFTMAELAAKLDAHT
ncbi:MAG: PAS domain S-box protein [Fimbriimonadales bacterium]